MRGLRDYKEEDKDDNGIDSDEENDFIALEPEEDEDSSDEDEAPNQHIKIRGSLNMTKYYDSEVAEKTNEEVQKKANFEKMMLAMDEKNKNKEVDMSQFPTYDFKAN